MTTSGSPNASVANCPIKLRVCHSLCYGDKKDRCAFPPEGNNKRGQENGRKK